MRRLLLRQLDKGEHVLERVSTVWSLVVAQASSPAKALGKGVLERVGHAAETVALHFSDTFLDEDIALEGVGRGDVAGLAAHLEKA